MFIWSAKFSSKNSSSQQSIILSFWRDEFEFCGIMSFLRRERPPRQSSRPAPRRAALLSAALRCTAAQPRRMRRRRRRKRKKKKNYLILSMSAALLDLHVPETLLNVYPLSLLDLVAKSVPFIAKNALYPFQK